MTITCAILCYNYGNYLEQSIKSCLNQQKGDYELEIIVIDDGSTDNTPEICHTFGNSITTYRSENQGFSASLTKAVEYATGQYICFLDADDYFASNKIISILPHIHSGWLFIKNNQFYIDDKGKVTKNSVKGGNTSTLTVERKAASTLLPAENELFFHPLFEAGKGVEITNSLTYYRFHNSNMTNRKDPGVWYTYLAIMTANLTSMLETNKAIISWVSNHELQRISYTYKSLSYYNLMEASVQLGDRYKAFVSGMRMIRHAIKSKSGITIWHLKVFVRCVCQMRTMEEYNTVKN